MNNRRTNKQRLFEILKKIDNTFTLNEEIIVDNLHLTDEDVNEIMKGYLEAAIWTEEERLNDESSSYDDENDYDEEDESDAQIQFMRLMKNQLQTTNVVSFTTEHIHPDSRIQAYLDIKNFVIAAGSIAISEALEENDKFQLGMDIWLTRNHHGAGFFDHNYENEQALMNAAHSLKEVDLYVGDDNKLYFSNAN